jgi:hypothetical protein
MLLSSSLDKMDQHLIQKVPLNITSKIDINFDLWNTINAQQKAATPINTWFLCLFEKLLSQGPKRLENIVGAVIPKVKLIVILIILA